MLPIVGWFAGLICLWVSDRWTTGDKVIGTLVVPGGFGVASLLFVTVSVGGGAGAVALALLLAASVVLPFATDVYLLWRLRRR